MKKLLNTIFITRQESYLHKERETIVIKQGNTKLGQFPALSVGNIMCFGQVSISPFLMGFCAEQGIGIAYYTQQGRFLARIQGRQMGNVLLRRTQYRWADDEKKTAEISRVIVAAKIANSRTVLLRQLRNHGDNLLLRQSSKQLMHCIRHCKNAQNLEVIRGIEGEAATVYFGVFNELLRATVFQFSGRVRRPPTDPVNALLSFIYSLITQECIAAL